MVFLEKEHEMEVYFKNLALHLKLFFDKIKKIPSKENRLGIILSLNKILDRLPMALNGITHGEI